MTGAKPPSPAGTTRLVVSHSCGHEVAHEFGGPPHTRTWQAKQRAKKPCQACRILTWQTEKAVDNATYAAIAQEQDLPDLVGTPKQVAWATTLRGALLDGLPVKLVELNRLADRRGHPRVEVPERGMALIRQVVLSETAAEWWINNQKFLGQQLVARHRSVFVGAGEVGQTARKLLMWAGS